MLIYVLIWRKQPHMINITSKNTLTQTAEHQYFLELIKKRDLGPSALTILLYALSVLQPGYIVSFNHLDINAAIGVKRTACFMAIKALKEAGIFLKTAKNQYQVNIGAVLNKRLNSVN